MRKRGWRVVGVLAHTFLLLVSTCGVTGAEAELLVTGSGAAQWARVIGPAATAAARAMPLVVGASVPDSSRIVVCTTIAEFRQYAGGMELAGVLGIARPDHDLVALNVSALGPGPERSLVGTLRHELVHLALGAAARQGGVRIPRWFDEGVASWFGGRYTDIGPIEVASLTRAPELRLERLDTSFPTALDRRRLAYVKSLTAVERLEAGLQGTVAAVVRRLAAGEPFPRALSAASGLTVEDLEVSAREHTRRRWLWLHLVRGAASPYGLLALLVVVGFAIRRWRLRRRLAGPEEFEP